VAKSTVFFQINIQINLSKFTNYFNF